MCLPLCEYLCVSVINDDGRVENERERASDGGKEKERKKIERVRETPLPPHSYPITVLWVYHPSGRILVLWRRVYQMGRESGDDEGRTEIYWVSSGGERRHWTEDERRFILLTFIVFVSLWMHFLIRAQRAGYIVGQNICTLITGVFVCTWTLLL